MTNPLYEAAYGSASSFASPRAVAAAAARTSRPGTTYPEAESAYAAPTPQGARSLASPTAVAANHAMRQGTPTSQMQPSAFQEQGGGVLPDGQDPEMAKQTAGQWAAEAGLNAIGATANLLDLPGSIGRDLFSLVPGGPKPRNPIDQALDPFGRRAHENRMEGREILRDYGLASRKKDTWPNFWGGLAVEIALDPLTYMSTFGLTRLGATMAKLGLKNTRGLAKEMAETAGKSSTWIGSAFGKAGITGNKILKHSNEFLKKKVVKRVDQFTEGKQLTSDAASTAFSHLDELPKMREQEIRWAMVDDGKQLQVHYKPAESTEWLLSKEGTRQAQNSLMESVLKMTPKELEMKLEGAYRHSYGKGLSDAQIAKMLEQDLSKPLRSMFSVGLPASRPWKEFTLKDPDARFQKWIDKQPELPKRTPFEPPTTPPGGAAGAATDAPKPRGPKLSPEELEARRASNAAKAAEAAKKSQVDESTAREALVKAGFDGVDLPPGQSVQKLASLGLLDESGNLIKSRIGEQATRVMYQAAKAFSADSADVVAHFPILEAFAESWGKIHKKNADEYFRDLNVRLGDLEGKAAAQYELRRGQRLITATEQAKTRSFLHEFAHDVEQMLKGTEYETEFMTLMDDWLRKHAPDAPMFRDGRLSEEASEAFAINFESFANQLTKEPVPKGLLDQIAAAIGGVYQSVKGVFSKSGQDVDKNFDAFFRKLYEGDVQPKQLKKTIQNEGELIHTTLPFTPKDDNALNNYLKSQANYFAEQRKANPEDFTPNVIRNPDGTVEVQWFKKPPQETQKASAATGGARATQAGRAASVQNETKRFLESYTKNPNGIDRETAARIAEANGIKVGPNDDVDTIVQKLIEKLKGSSPKTEKPLKPLKMNKGFEEHQDKISRMQQEFADIYGNDVGTELTKIAKKFVEAGNNPKAIETTVKAMSEEDAVGLLGKIITDPDFASDQLMQAAYHGTAARFDPERLVKLPDGTEKFIKQSDELPPGATVIEEAPLGRFDLSFVSTGEGRGVEGAGQAYGYGLYFASQERLARHYRGAIAGEKSVLTIDNSPIGKFYSESRYSENELKALRRLERYGNIKEAKEALERDASLDTKDMFDRTWSGRLYSDGRDELTNVITTQDGSSIKTSITTKGAWSERYEGMPFFNAKDSHVLVFSRQGQDIIRSGNSINELQDLAYDLIQKSPEHTSLENDVARIVENSKEQLKFLNELEASGRLKVSKPGSIYKAELPEDDVLMYWEKPISEQHPNVQEKLRRLGMDEKSKWDDTPSDFYGEGSIARSDGSFVAPLRGEWTEITDDLWDVPGTWRYGDFVKDPISAAIVPDQGVFKATISSVFDSDIERAFDNLDQAKKWVEERSEGWIAYAQGSGRFGETKPVGKQFASADEAKAYLDRAHPPKGLKGEEVYERLMDQAKSNPNPIIMERLKPRVDRIKNDIKSTFPEASEEADKLIDKNLADKLADPLNTADIEGLDDILGASSNASDELIRPILREFVSISNEIGFQNEISGFSAKKYASRKLAEAGIRGNKVPANFLGGGNKKGDYNFVIFDDRDVKILERFDQRAAEGIKGTTTFSQEGEAIINIVTGKGDVSTAIHELAHVFRRNLRDDLTEQANKAMEVQLKDADTLKNILGKEAKDVKLMDESGKWTRDAEEVFARLFEKWLATGQAPKGLAQVFAKLKEAMMNIYKKISGSEIDGQISDELRTVFEGMFTPKHKASTGQYDNTAGKWAQNLRKSAAEPVTPSRPNPIIQAAQQGAEEAVGPQSHQISRPRPTETPPTDVTRRRDLEIDKNLRKETSKRDVYEAFMRDPDGMDSSGSLRFRNDDNLGDAIESLGYDTTVALEFIENLKAKLAKDTAPNAAAQTKTPATTTTKSTSAVDSLIDIAKSADSPVSGDPSKKQIGPIFETKQVQPDLPDDTILNRMSRGPQIGRPRPTETPPSNVADTIRTQADSIDAANPRASQAEPGQADISGQIEGGTNWVNYGNETYGSTINKPGTGKAEFTLRFSGDESSIYIDTFAKESGAPKGSGRSILREIVQESSEYKPKSISGHFTNKESLGAFGSEFGRDSIKFSLRLSGDPVDISFAEAMKNPEKYIATASLSTSTTARKTFTEAANPFVEATKPPVTSKPAIQSAPEGVVDDVAPPVSREAPDAVSATEDFKNLTLEQYHKIEDPEIRRMAYNELSDPDGVWFEGVKVNALRHKDEIASSLNNKHESIQRQIDRVKEMQSSGLPVETAVANEKAAARREYRISMFGNDADPRNLQSYERILDRLQDELLDVSSSDLAQSIAWKPPKAIAIPETPRKPSLDSPTARATREAARASESESDAIQRVFKNHKAQDTLDDVADITDIRGASEAIDQAVGDIQGIPVGGVDEFNDAMARMVRNIVPDIAEEDVSRAAKWLSDRDTRLSAAADRVGGIKRANVQLAEINRNSMNALVGRTYKKLTTNQKDEISNRVIGLYQNNLEKLSGLERGSISADDLRKLDLGQVDNRDLDVLSELLNSDKERHARLRKSIERGADKTFTPKVRPHRGGEAVESISAEEAEKMIRATDPIEEANKNQKLIEQFNADIEDIKVRVKAKELSKAEGKDQVQDIRLQIKALEDADPTKASIQRRIDEAKLELGGKEDRLNWAEKASQKRRLEDEISSLKEDIGKLEEQLKTAPESLSAGASSNEKLSRLFHGMNALKYRASQAGDMAEKVRLENLALEARNKILEEMSPRLQGAARAVAAESGRLNNIDDYVSAANQVAFDLIDSHEFLKDGKFTPIASSLLKQRIRSKASDRALAAVPTAIDESLVKYVESPKDQALLKEFIDRNKNESTKISQTAFSQEKDKQIKGIIQAAREKLKRDLATGVAEAPIEVANAKVASDTSILDIAQSVSRPSFLESLSADERKIAEAFLEIRKDADGFSSSKPKDYGVKIEAPEFDETGRKLTRKEMREIESAQAEDIVRSAYQAAKKDGLNPNMTETEFRETWRKIQQNAVEKADEYVRFDGKTAEQLREAVISHKLVKPRWDEIISHIRKDSESAADMLLAALDTGENLFLANPAMAKLVQLFDKAVLGAGDYNAQELARKKFELAERGTFEFRSALYPVVNYLGKNNFFDPKAAANEMIKRGMGRKEAIKAGRKTVNDRNNDVLRFFESVDDSHKLSPEIFGVSQEKLNEFENLLGSLKKLFPDLLEEEIAAGLGSRALFDMEAKFFHRNLTLPNRMLRTRLDGEALMSAKMDSQFQRDDAFRHIVGGRATINELSVDPKISGIALDEPIQGQISKETMDRMREHVIETYGAENVISSRTLWESGEEIRYFDDAGKLNEKGKEKLDALLSKIARLPKAHVEEQVPMFGHNFMRDFASYVESHYLKKAVALTVQDLVASTAVHGGDQARTVKQLFQKTSLDNHNAYENVIRMTDNYPGYKKWKEGKFQEWISPGEGKKAKIKINDDGTVTALSKDFMPDYVKRGIPEGAHYSSIEELAKIKNLASEYVTDSKLMNLTIPAEMYDSMTMFLGAWTHNPTIGPIAQVAGAMLNMFKGLVTLPFPAFHVRNFVSGQMQNVYYGAFDPTDPAFYFKPIRQAHDLANGNAIKGISKEIPDYILESEDILPVIIENGVKKIQKGTAEADELVSNWIRERVFRFGLTGDKKGYAAEKIEDTTSTLISQNPGAQPRNKENWWGLKRIYEDKTSTLGQKANPLLMEGGLLPSIGKAPGHGRSSLQLKRIDQTDFIPGQIGAEMSQLVENVNRIAPFLAFLKQGFSPEEAARRVNMIQFDYSRISQFESKVMKQLIPFYTFNSRALKLTLGDLVTNPAGLQAWTLRGVNRAQDPSQPIPEHIRRGVAIPLRPGPGGEDRYFSGFGLAWEDPIEMAAFLYGDPKEGMASLFTKIRPEIQGAVELATGRSLFFGRELQDMDPQLGRLRENLKGTKEKGLAEPLLGSQSLELLSSKLPTARAVSAANTLMDHRKTAVDKFLALSSGFKFTTVNEEARNRILMNRYNEIIKDSGGRDMTLTYIPEWQKERLSSEELQKLDSLKKLKKELQDRNKELQKERKAQELQNAVSTPSI